jgi:alkylation response protein AidB-like acyl-CoA dehydrogenase
MDFSHSPEHREIRKLADEIFGAQLTGDRLWDELRHAGLLSLTLPESCGGGGLGLLDASAVLIETGRHTAPIPAFAHIAAATVLARYGTAQQCQHPGVLAPAITDARGQLRDMAVTPSESGYRLSGIRALVPAGMVADAFLIPAQTDSGTAVFLVEAVDDGVTRREQRVSGGYRLAQLELADVAIGPDRRIGPADGSVATFLKQVSIASVCAQQFGVTSEAVVRTAAYAGTRKQFGRPIGSFQAVAHRLADGYLDVLGQELTLWKALSHLDHSVPAQAAVAAAKFWACEAGHRVAHSAIHIHGGVGVDLSGDIHRYYSMAKHLEFTYGSAHQHATDIGRLMGSPGFFENE